MKRMRSIGGRAWRSGFKSVKKPLRAAWDYGSAGGESECSRYQAPPIATRFAAHHQGLDRLA